MTIAINKINGRDLINTAHRECLPKKIKMTRAVENYPKIEWSASVIKVSEQIHNEAFKRRLAFNFTVIILA